MRLPCGIGQCHVCLPLLEVSQDVPDKLFAAEICKAHTDTNIYLIRSISGFEHQLYLLVTVQDCLGALGIPHQFTTHTSEGTGVLGS